MTHIHSLSPSSLTHAQHFCPKGEPYLGPDKRYLQMCPTLREMRLKYNITVQAPSEKGFFGRMIQSVSETFTHFQYCTPLKSAYEWAQAQLPENPFLFLTMSWYDPKALADSFSAERILQCAPSLYPARLLFDGKVNKFVEHTLNDQTQEPFDPSLYSEAPHTGMSSNQTFVWQQSKHAFRHLALSLLQAQHLPVEKRREVLNALINLGYTPDLSMRFDFNSKDQAPLIAPSPFQFPLFSGLTKCIRVLNVINTELLPEHALPQRFMHTLQSMFSTLQEMWAHYPQTDVNFPFYDALLSEDHDRALSLFQSGQFFSKKYAEIHQKISQQNAYNLMFLYSSDGELTTLFKKNTLGFEGLSDETEKELQHFMLENLIFSDKDSAFLLAFAHIHQPQALRQLFEMHAPTNGTLNLMVLAVLILEKDPTLFELFLNRNGVLESIQNFFVEMRQLADMVLEDWRAQNNFDENESPFTAKKDEMSKYMSLENIVLELGKHLDETINNGNHDYYQQSLQAIKAKLHILAKKLHIELPGIKDAHQLTGHNKDQIMAMISEFNLNDEDHTLYDEAHNLSNNTAAMK